MIERRPNQFVIVSCLSLCVCKILATKVPSVKYTRHNGCYSPIDQTLVLTKCMEIRQARSFLECISLCSSHSWCAGTAKHPDDNCRFYYPCQYLRFGINCKATDTSAVSVYTKPGFESVTCGPRGVYNYTSGTCDCPLGWTGLFCDVAPADCGFLLAGRYPAGRYLVEVRLSRLVNVTCEVTSGSCRLLLASNSGRSNHNKTWAEYVAGYAIDGNNFFLGLDSIHTLTASGSRGLKIDAVFDEASNTFLTWTYAGVAVSGPLSRYAITYTSASCQGSSQSFCSSSLPKCIVPMMVFSTYDVALNLLSVVTGPAVQAVAGWWFDATPVFSFSLYKPTEKCNPLGRLASTLPSTVTDGRLILPGLDMVSGSYVSSFQYVVIYFTS